jgi:hypothetical protein
MLAPKVAAGTTTWQGIPNMSFVAGFVTGMTTGEAVERRKGRGHFREYMESHGFTVIDQHGRTVPLDTIVDQALQTRPRSLGRNILIAGAALVALTVISGGSAWAAVAAVR